MLCPYGRNCIDPGKPSDCEVNSACVNFSSDEEKAAFDSLPDHYYFEDEAGNKTFFKTKNQLDFYLADLDQKTKERGKAWGHL